MQTSFEWLFEPPASRADSTSTITCQACPAVFTPNTKGRPRKFCFDCCHGRTHSRLWRAARSDKQRGEEKKKARARYERAKAKKELARQAAYCRNCGDLLVGQRRKFCGYECNKKRMLFERHLTRQSSLPGGGWPTKVCEECGEDFDAVQFSEKPRRYCSVKCGRRAALRIRTKARRAALATDLVCEVDPNEIFARDNWACMACGVDTPRWLKGSLEPNAPELDHIIPLSRGGAHAQDNCRCLCRRCNSDKGSQTDDEWRGIVLKAVA